MLDPLRVWMSDHGLSQTIADLIILAASVSLVLILAFLADRVASRIVVRWVRHLTRQARTGWDDVIATHRVLPRLAHLAPALVVFHFSAIVLEGYGTLATVVRQAALIYMIVLATLALNGALNAAVTIFRDSRVAREIPLKSFAQVVTLVLYAIATISIISLVIGRSPLLLLSGFGAISAVLMLVFKDAILGFVAGIQLSANGMVSRGDWIEMPKHGADGDVIEVGLTTVKVQNWDKTITTIPTYSLITESFKNWRGMSEAGGRRIKRSITIDISTIRFCDETMLERFSKIQYIAEYLQAKQDEIDRWNADHHADPASPANVRQLTNIGTFRVYIIAYLKSHPMIAQDMTFLVRQLAPTAHGLPLEIYVFSRDKVWSHYEAIQADIFDHLLAVVPQFDLRVFQSPSGPDVERALAAAQRSFDETPPAEVALAASGNRP